MSYPPARTACRKSFLRRLLPACMLLLAMLVSSQAMAQGTDLLSNERWESRGEGLTLLPPAGTQMMQVSGDDAILRIGHADGYRITIYIKESTRDLTLDEVVNAAVLQATRTPTTVRKVEDPFNIKLDALDARGFSFAAPDVTPPAVLVQVFAMLSPQRVMIIELNSPPLVFEKARKAFDQMLGSVTFKDPRKLMEERKVQLEAGRKWFSEIKPEAMRKALIAQQWFRMTDGTDDIGYMRIRQSSDKVMQRPGVRVDIQSRLVVGDVAYDTLSNYFATDAQDRDGRNEVWSVRTTARPQSKPSLSRNQPQTEENSWAETGLYSKGTLSLTRQSPQEKKPYEWNNLPEFYLSQAHAMLLPQLLDPTVKDTLAFYAYYANTGKIALRTERVVAASDGSYKVFSRMSPELDEQVTWFDAKGNIIKRVLPGGQVMVPATATQINTRWQLKD